MKCANCNKPALFEYKLTLKNSLFYCNTHLPVFLDARKKAGLLHITPENNKELESALEAISFVPETVAEEVVEEPKPKKKAAKKKAE